MIILSRVLVTACPHRYFQSGRSKEAAQIAGARRIKTYLWEKATLLMLSSAQLDGGFLPQHHVKNNTLNLHHCTQILRNKGNTIRSHPRSGQQLLVLTRS